MYTVLILFETNAYMHVDSKACVFVGSVFICGSLVSCTFCEQTVVNITTLFETNSIVIVYQILDVKGSFC